MIYRIPDILDELEGGEEDYEVIVADEQDNEYNISNITWDHLNDQVVIQIERR